MSSATHPAAEESASFDALARAAGVEASPELVQLLVELLQLDVTPQGLIALLRAVKDSRVRSALNRKETSN